jgi:hypothetical protein
MFARPAGTICDSLLLRSLHLVIAYFRRQVPPKPAQAAKELGGLETCSAFARPKDRLSDTHFVLILTNFGHGLATRNSGCLVSIILVLYGKSQLLMLVRRLLASLRSSIPLLNGDNPSEGSRSEYSCANESLLPWGMNYATTTVSKTRYVIAKTERRASSFWVVG